MSVRELVDRSPVSGLQIRVLIICVVLNLVDGFDILVMSFTASRVAAEWSLTGSQLGLLLSAGLAGMAVGSAVLSPLADRIGRRPLTLLSLAVSATGMLLASLSTGFAGLGLARLLTGIGVGGMVAGLPVLLSEFAPAVRRGTFIALYTVGLPLGGVLGGGVTVLLVESFGWRAPFVAGFVVTAVMLGVVAAGLPESPEYLIARRPRGALDTLNRQFAAMGHTPWSELPSRPVAPERTARTGVLTGRAATTTALLWVCFFSVMAGFYFAASWTPRLLEQSGLSAQQGMSGGVLLNLGGVVATLAFSVLAVVASVRALTVVSLLATAAAFLAMPLALGNLTATLVVAVAVGAALNANAAGLFTLAPALYPAAVRATAVGWAAAVGRLGAISAPVLAGVLLDRGWTPSSLFVLFAIPMGVAAAAVLVLTRKPSVPSPEHVAKERATNS